MVPSRPDLRLGRDRSRSPSRRTVRTEERRQLRRRVAIGVLGALVVGASASACDGSSSQEGNQSSSRPPGTSETEVFRELRARPVRAPRLRPGAFCPDPSRGAVGLPPSIPAEAGLGTGSVHAVSRAIPRFLDFFPPEDGSPLARSRWRANETMWVSEPDYRGPVLIRGRKVGGQARVGFGTGVRPVWELRLPAGPWAETDRPLRIWGRLVRPPAGWRVTTAYTRVPVRASRRQDPDCYFFQVDGLSFSESIVFGAIIQP